MKAFRKSLSILLAMLMVFSLAVVSTVAETTPLEITKQPTVNDPSVEVNAYDVSYQWYAASSETVNGVLTDVNARPINNDSPMSEGISSFDNTTGEWTPVADGYYKEFFWISLSAGDSITLNFSGEVEETGLENLETMNAFWGVPNDDGSYTVTVDEEGEFIVMAYAVDEIVTVVAYGETFVYAPIEAETSAVLSSLAVGNKYYCEVTRGDEIVKTDIVVAEYAIVKQPTLADPSVEVTFPDDASYQWCTAVKEDVEVGDTTYGVTKTWGTYDSTLGVWTPFVYGEGSDYDVLYICNIDLYVGDTVTVAVEGNVPADVCFGNNKTMSAQSAVPNDDGTYTYTVTSKANYTLFVDAVCEGTTVKITANTYRLEPIEDETSSALSGFSSGKNYLCQITYKDGTVLYTDYFAAKKVVTKQPTASDPSVEASLSEEIQSYRWYKKGDTTSKGEIDDVQAYPASISYVMELESVPEGVDYTVINESSYYDTALGAWIPAVIEIFEDKSYFGFMVDLEAGETLTIELLENSVIDDCSLADINNPYFGGYQGDLNEDGTYSVTVETTSTYMLRLYPARNIIMSLSDSSADVSTAFRAYGKTVVYEPIEGETDFALSSVEYGEEYFCEITYNDETVIRSDVLRAIPEIITQPTSEMPLVEVTFEDKVTSYQWYKLEKGDKVVTDDDAYPADYTDEEQGPPAYYDSETQLWHPAYYNDWEETESVVVDGRVYFDNSNSSWDEVYIHCFDYAPEYISETEWPGTKMTNIEGTDIWYYDIPDAYNMVVFNNGAGTQSRDLLIGTHFTDEFNCYDIANDSFSFYEEEIAVRIYEFDLFGISLKAGEILTIVPSEELYYGEMNIDDWITPNEDGEYVYYAEEDVQLYVYAQDDGDMDITFYATVSNRTVLTEVEGATDAIFLPEEAGEYLCVITYEDGVVLTSDPVELDPESISITRGDVNGDGIIDMFDYLMVKSYYFEVSTPNALEAFRADINEDGDIDMFDYLEVKTAYFNS